MEQGRKIVYLVSHRSLASQKFEEIKKVFKPWLGGDLHAIMCATGDGVIDGSGRANSSSLSATILVATYEKYLSLISGGGLPKDLSNFVFVCDEIQLVSDGSRGKHVELLLSLLKRNKWYQFIGLSAVMDDVGAKRFAEWLNLSLVQVDTREKSLTIEGRYDDGHLIAKYTPHSIEPIRQEPEVKERELNSMIEELISLGKKPVIVFCMKVDDCYNLAEKWTRTQKETQPVEVPAGLDIDPDLLELIKKRCAYHNAEMSEAECTFVEDLMKKKTIEVVFATSTLAAGVNFPFGSAVFSAWKRYNNAIPHDEFQNMAGRVGRMGQEEDDGIVLATAEDTSKAARLKDLMDFSKREPLGAGIEPKDFGTLVIQLFASGLCKTRDEAFLLMSSTLSAYCEMEEGHGDVEHWRPHLDQQIDRFINAHCLIDTKGQIIATQYGKAVARSGLKPETIEHFLEYLNTHGEQAAQLLPTHEQTTLEQQGRDDDLLFIFTHGSLLSPEFTDIGGPKSRDIKHRFKDFALKNPKAEALENLLFNQKWDAYPRAANAAMVLSEWASGADHKTLKGLVPGIRLGVIETMARDVSWLLAAVSEVIRSSSLPSLADEARHPLLSSTNSNLLYIRKLSLVMRRYAMRIKYGLPSECCWLKELELQGPKKCLSRMQIISIHKHDISRPHLLMDGSEEMDKRRQEALPKVGGVSYANQVREAARKWKVKQRRHFRERHEKKAVNYDVKNIISNLYEMKGKELEKAVSDAFQDLGINCKVLDDGKNPGYPDLKIEFKEKGMASDIVAEVKSKEKETSLVSLGEVTKVLSSAQLAGLKGMPLITICSPGMDPSIPTLISNCDNLSVIEIVDLVEAYLGIKDGNLTITNLYDWLATPGPVLMDTLPFNNF